MFFWSFYVMRCVRSQRKKLAKLPLVSGTKAGSKIPEYQYQQVYYLYIIGLLSLNTHTSLSYSTYYTPLRGARDMAASAQ
jgi:hypothetical protein